MPLRTEVEELAERSLEELFAEDREQDVAGRDDRDAEEYGESFADRGAAERAYWRSRQPSAYPID